MNYVKTFVYKLKKMCKKGRSAKTGKNGYCHKHHISPRRLKKGKENKETINLTPTEHVELHEHIDCTDDVDGILGLTLAWLLGKIFD